MRSGAAFARAATRLQDGCMRPLLSCCLLCLLLAGAGPARGVDPVTVHRCVDARGHVTLGDVPCADGSTGRTLEMQRPTDGEPLNRASPRTASPPPPPVLVVTARTPQPMYECVTADGDRYTSDNGEGNPRWVPLWTLGYRSDWRPGDPTPRAGSSALGDYYANRPLGGRVGAPTARPDPPSPGSGRPHRPGHPHRPGDGGYGGYGVAGTWVRDTCHALPQGEVCSRLVDRREQIRQRFFNAQQRERDTLRVEERGINARLAADCGNH